MDTPIVFRAYLPARPGSLPILLKQLHTTTSHNNITVLETSEKHVEFSIGQMKPYFLHHLLASKVTIITPLKVSMEDHGRMITVDKVQEGVDSTFDNTIHNMVQVWSQLGNRQAFLGTPPTFALHHVDRSFISCRRHKKSKKQQQQQSSTHNDGEFLSVPRTNRNNSFREQTSLILLSTVRQKLSNRFGWTHKHCDVDLPMELELLNTSTELDMANATLELCVLKRIYPLVPMIPVPTTTTTTRRTKFSKRLESFIVAKLASIEPGQIVLDPQCQRGTILVEGAKYWPLAEYIGMDTNLGHLDHARMNADSTYTCLKLLHITSSKSNNGMDSWSTMIPNFSVDRIVSCLSFGQNTDYYASFLRNGVDVLKPGGSMTLVIDRMSLATLEDGRKNSNISSYYCLSSTIICQDTIEWGKKQAMVIKLIKMDLPVDPYNVRPTTNTNSSFESSYPNHQSPTISRSLSLPSWTTIRDQEIPQLVPLWHIRQAMGHKNMVQLYNGKVYLSS